MKKLLTLLSLLVVAVSTFAQEFTIGDLTYSVLSQEEKTAQVVNGRNATGTVVVPETVTYNDIEYSVTTLHTYAFDSNTNITSIELPNITSIGQYAFSGCSSLTSVIIPVVNFIDYNAFYGCSNIKSMRIGSVEQWCKVNFDGNASPLQCTSQQVDLYIGSSESPATIVELPNTVTEIPNYAFSNTTITSFSAPFATSIGSDAFAGCESLEEAILPKVETIGDNAFGVYGIDDDNGWQYHYCTSLKYVDLSSVTSIGYNAFGSGVDGCSNIKSLRVGSIEQWCNVNFGDTNSNPLDYYRKSVDLYIGESQERATEIEIPSTITEIGREAFCNTTITSIHAQNVISVGVNAFYGCELLTTVDLPMATTIETNAFQECSSLKSVNLPSALTIGGRAFESCKSLARVDLSSVKSIDNDAFQGCSNISSLRIGSVDQWCQVSFGQNYANPLKVTSQAVTLYVGDSETPAKNLVASNALTEIPDHAFFRIDIESFSAPAATTIGAAAFASCTSLVSIDIPEATNIGNSAFSGTALTTVNLPAATTIGSYAFSGSAITSVNLPVATTIGSYAFSGSAITSVNLPVATTIESYAFQGCESLEEAILPKVETLGSYAFDADYNDNEHRYMTSLKNIDLSSVKTIGEGAFLNCQELSRLELPEVRVIGSWAFGGMSSLKYLSIPKVENIGTDAFGSSPNIDSLRIGSVEQYCNIKYQVYEGMDEWAYKDTFPFGNDDNYNDKNFLFIGDSETPATEITIPESVGQVPDFAFLGTGIHTIHYEGTTPPALVSTNSFSEWTMLVVPEEAYETYLAADVYNTIPLQITKDGHITQDLEVEANSTTSALLAKIGDQEIRYVVNLKLKGTINSYDMLIIRNRMTSLRNLDLSEASIVDCDFAYSTSNGNNYHSIKDEITGDWLMGLMNVKLPANTKTIGYEAFRGCYRLLSVDIPDGVESIGDYAFYGCNRIKDLTLPQSVTSFGKWAFYYCTGLREVVIPDGVTSINSYAFYGCRDLEKVMIPASVKNIGYDAFKEVGNEYWDDNRNGFYRTPISLRISDINSWMDTEIEGGTFSDNVGTLFIGDSDEPVDHIVIPAGITELKRNIFSGFSCLKSMSLPEELTTIGNGTFRNTDLTDVTMPKNLQNIGDYAFSYCANLENVEFADGLKTIGECAFLGCYNLKKIELPSYLQTVGDRAFYGCGSLTEVLIPASIQEIGDYAFENCDNLNTVIATTVEPIRINQNTFSTYRTANVYSPKTSYWKYYWNTQWNQFLSVKEYDKEFAEAYGYKYFYLNGKNGDTFEDFVIDDETGPLHGANHYEQFPPIEKAPDADFNESAGMIVGGEQIQELGDIHIHHNGNNGASVIAKAEGKVHIDNLYVDIKTQKNRWYFFCFPFDINPGEATFDGSHVWYLYDGEARALNGNGGWKKLANDGVMKMGNGYIFQGAVNGTLTIHVSDLTIDASDKQTNLITYQSDNKNDASWNLVGNSNMAYYGISDLMLNDVPVTVYNNETGNYEAVRPGDDDYEFYPFQAFFVQKPEGIETLTLAANKQDTKNKVDLKKAARLAGQANAPKRIDAKRKIINLELASVGMTDDSVAVATDRTRIVVNPIKSVGYETECDAAKFIADNMPQIYSLDNEGCTYAINERPVENGIINIAVKTPAEGFYTIIASRLDCDAKLLDLETGIEADLTKGGYTFAAEAATYTQRFQLILAGGTTGILTAEDAKNAIAVEAGAISIDNANADVRVYTIGGVLIASQKGAGSINVAPGAYVVNINGQSVKVTVNE